MKKPKRLKTRGGKYYSCRLCYDLTYTSCQKAHKYDHLYRLLVADTEMTPSAVKRILDGKPRSKLDYRRESLIGRLFGFL